ncbi:MAG TPA: hypothetical protein ENN38_06250 [Actinobacteria bacterium]|nr:hypothetical protein [Actinomycetota bacterium]
MDLYFIDSLASSGKSFFHKASAISKMFFSASVIFAIMLSKNPVFLGILLLFLLLFLKLLRQPVFKIFAMTFYVAVFAIIYALSQISGPPVWPFMIVLKAITAALSILTLLTTTNYFEVFAVFGKFLPKLIADGLFMTYRSFFILLKVLNNLITAVKVKGGFSPCKIFSNLRNMGGVLGTLFIHAMDSSTRNSEILTIRGYRGGLARYRGLRKLSKYDFIPFLLGGVIFAVAGVFK